MLTVVHVTGTRARSLPWSDVDASMRSDGYLWLDVADPTEAEVEVLESSILGLDPLLLEDMLEDEHLPKLDIIGDQVLLTVHAIDVEQVGEELATREVDLVLAPGLLVTFHRGGVVSVEHVLQRLLDRGATGIERPVMLMHRILDVMNDVFVPFVNNLDERLDIIEQDIFGEPTDQTRREIFGLQRDVIQLRRAVVPQAEVLRRLGRADAGLLDPEDERLFRDIHDHLYRMAQLSDSYQQLLDSALQSYRSAVDADLNQMLKVLTLVSATLLPISVLASIYGMNFTNMPELDWQWGYFALVGVFGLIVVTQLVLFRRAGWIGGRAQREAARRRDTLSTILEVPVLGTIIRVPVAGARAVQRTGRRLGRRQGA